MLDLRFSLYGAHLAQQNAGLSSRCVEGKNLVCSKDHVREFGMAGQNVHLIAQFYKLIVKGLPLLSGQCLVDFFEMSLGVEHVGVDGVGDVKKVWGHH